MTVQSDLARSVEAMLFVTDEPIASSVLAGSLDVDRRQVDAACEELARSYDERASGLTLRNVGGGWRLFTHPDVAPTVERFVLSSRQARLTKAALETLAIVAYKQPVTRHQVSSIRGVNSDGVLKALTDRALIAEVGREEGPGRPVLYGTTPEFLERLGLPSLSSLPSLAPLLGADTSSEEDDGTLGGTETANADPVGPPSTQGREPDPATVVVDDLDPSAPGPGVGPPESEAK